MGRTIAKMQKPSIALVPQKNVPKPTPIEDSPTAEMDAKEKALFMDACRTGFKNPSSRICVELLGKPN
jgi:hypothetical protein